MGRFGNWLAQAKRDQMKVYGHDVPSMVHRDRMAYVRVNNLAAHTELAEALQSLDWKPWRAGVNDWDCAKLELVDTLMFVANQLLACGVTDDELERLYADKTSLNHVRAWGGTR